MSEVLKSPYPYFGGKSRIASAIWERFGLVDCYVEPFFGSGAVLLANPNPPKVESVNDLDAWLSNFWASLQVDSDGVARHADYPVDECRLHAAGDALFYNRAELVKHCHLCGEDKSCPFAESCPQTVEEFRGAMDQRLSFYCVVAAGLWVYGQCAWIGSGWGPRQRPHLGDAGQGVNRQRPHLGNAGMGVNRQRPHLGDAGRGVNRQRPHLGDAGKGCEPQTPIGQYLAQLKARMEHVRICCGDWSRVCGPSVTFTHGLTAVMLDPPYGAKDRDDCYSENSYTVAGDVRKWCAENGGNPLLRICLCGYEGEGHEILEGMEWSVLEWKGAKGFAKQGANENENRKRERIWFNRSCLPPTQGGLFGGAE